MKPTAPLATKKYIGVLRDTHASHKAWGCDGWRHANEIVIWAGDLGAKSILDYGCGAGTLKDALRHKWIDIREYDPGVLHKDGLPTYADLVVCTDVLEHVEPECLDGVLAHIRALARFGAFFVIDLELARKVMLTDGRNPHLSVHPWEWWIERLTFHEFKVAKCEVKKGLTVWAKSS